MKTFDQFWTEFGAGIAWNPDSKDAAHRVWLAARAGMNVDNEAAFDQLLHNPRELAQQDADAFGIGYVVDGQRVAPHRVQVFAPAAKATGTAGELPPLPPYVKYALHCLAGEEAKAEAERQMREYGQACAEAARQPAPVDEIEQVAKAIYQLIPGDGQGSPTDHPWQPGGNSDMQDLARRMARAALAATNRSQP